MLEWIEPEAWEAFKEMRKKIKSPMTPFAEKLLVRELVKLKSSGEDPQACLEQSILNGWRDVYPLRDKGLSSAASSADETRAYLESQRLTQEQRAASMQARKMAMGSIRRVS